MFGVNIEKIFTTMIAFSKGIVDNLSPFVQGLFITFVIIDLTMSFIFDESDGMSVVIKLVKKVLYYFFFWYIILEYKTLVFDHLFPGAIQLANVATGNGSSQDFDFGALDSIKGGFLAGVGTIATGIGLSLGDYFGVESIAIIGLGLVASLYIFFIMLYIQVVTIYLKFYLVAGVTFILMPFAGFDKTKDITNKGLNGLFSQAIEVFVTTIILLFIKAVRDSNVLDFEHVFNGVDDGVYDTVWTKFVFMIFMFMLINKAGTISSAILSGSIAALGIGASSMSNAISGMKNNAGKAMIRQDKYGNEIGALAPIGNGIRNARKQMSNKIKDIYSRFK